MRKYVTEAIGTFVLVLAVGLSENAFAIGLVLTAMIYMGVHVSGAHFNPAVSFAFFIKQQIDFNTFIGFSVSQILGTFAAAGVLLSLSNVVFYIEPPTSTGLYEQAFAEVLFSFVLVITYLSVFTRSSYKSLRIHGLVIGLVLTGITIAGRELSGSVYNPAISIGTSAMDFLAIQGGSYKSIPLYTLAPITGAALAALTHRYLND